MHDEHARIPHRLSRRLFWTSVIIATLLALTAITLQAQSGDGYTLTWWTVDTGGITTGTAVGYTLGATSGQPDADPQSATGSGYALQGGFWQADIAVPAGTVVSRVWTDSNLNGIRDAGEVGLNGVTVNLYAAAPETLLATTVTTTTAEGAGIYTFGAQSPDSYIVEVVAPPGRQFTLQGQGADPGFDSDVDPATGRSAVITLPDGGVLNVDAGILPVPTADDEAPEPGGVSSRVWLPTITR